VLKLVILLTFLFHYEFGNFLRDTRIHFNIYNNVNINLVSTHVVSFLQTFWDPKMFATMRERA